MLARLRELQGSVRTGPAPIGSGPPPPSAPAYVVPGAVVDDIEYVLRIYADRDDRAADLLGRLRHCKSPAPGGWDNGSGWGGGWAGPRDDYDARGYGPRDSRSRSRRYPAQDR